MWTHVLWALFWLFCMCGAHMNGFRAGFQRGYKRGCERGIEEMRNQLLSVRESFRRN